MSSASTVATFLQPEHFRPCLGIPVYNHRDAIAGTWSDLAANLLPCVAVDDGSTDGSAEVLERLAQASSLLTVIHRPRNGGKGAAVIDALRWALDRGFTHLLLVDADGQHAAGDVPRFLERAREKPSALILGCPLFDSSAPRARVYGRELSNALVCLQTLSLQVRDVLCGFRVYPLEPAATLLPFAVKSRRMEFDLEAVVRLRWAKVEVVNVPTEVKYPADGLSHFRYLFDNLLIAWTHIRLLAGMLIRLPVLLWQRRN
jgi:glycosyltransferase involved in cell wall biosynthesis